jgi:molecular chaperone GrpE
MTKKSSKNKVKEEVLNELESAAADVLNEDASPVADTAESPEKEEETCEDQIEVLEKQLAEMNDKHLRLIAEYDNYRKRTLKEKMDLTKSAGERIFVKILPVVDDFERALQHLDAASDLDSVKEGIGLIYNKFVSFLTQQGVKVIDTKDQDFDADLHEAITKIPAPSEGMKGKIVDCVEKGYLLEEKVIRFPKVVVGE